MKSEVVELAGNDITIWVEPGGPLCIKALTAEGDPVELAEHEVEDLILALRRLSATMTG